MGSAPARDQRCHLEQGEQVVAVVDRDLEEGEEHHGDNPDVEARLPSVEVGNGTERGLGSKKEMRKEGKAPEDEGSQDKPNDSKCVQVCHIVSNPTNPIVLGDKSVFELGVIVTPLAAAGQLGIRLKIQFRKKIFSLTTWISVMLPVPSRITCIFSSLML